MPNINIFSGENAAIIFADPRPMLIFARDTRRNQISETFTEEMTKETEEAEKIFKSLAVKHKEDFVVTFLGAEDPMDMR